MWRLGRSAWGGGWGFAGLVGVLGDWCNGREWFVLGPILALFVDDGWYIMLESIGEEKPPLDLGNRGLGS